VFITIAFCLPTANPVTSQTLNYTPVAVGIVLVLSLAAWILWAHRWFTGPRRQVELEQAGISVEEQAMTGALTEKEMEAGVVPEKSAEL
jgi:hypothetical protein